LVVRYRGLVFACLICEICVICGPMQNDPRTFAIIGAAMEVHRQLGCGFLEPVYQEALALELAARAVPCRREVELPIFYKGRHLKATYRADFVCYESIVVELKALARLSGTEEAQLLNYSKASGHEIGLLLNFGAPSLDYKRFIWSPQVSQITPMKDLECA
jgi:GxxExxY protein